MHKAFRYAVLVWCAVGLGGTLSADTRLTFDVESCQAFNDTPYAPVGLLNPESHQHLLSLLGRPVLTLIDPLDGLHLAASTALSASSLTPTPAPGTGTDPMPQRVPEPGMFTLLILTAAAVLGVRRRRR